MLFSSEKTAADWPEAMATVTACSWASRVGRAIAFGLPTSRHFLIRFHFFAGEQEQTGEFYAQKPMPVGTLFPLRYNPDDPSKPYISDCT